MQPKVTNLKWFLIFYKKTLTQICKTNSTKLPYSLQQRWAVNKCFIFSSVINDARLMHRISLEILLFILHAEMANLKSVTTYSKRAEDL